MKIIEREVECSVRLSLSLSRLARIFRKSDLKNAGEAAVALAYARTQSSEELDSRTAATRRHGAASPKTTLFPTLRVSFLRNSLEYFRYVSSVCPIWTTESLLERHETARLSVERSIVTHPFDQSPSHSHNFTSDFQIVGRPRPPAREPRSPRRPSPPSCPNTAPTRTRLKLSVKRSARRFKNV